MDEVPIASGDAASTFGIEARHSRMVRTDERRFRLLKRDGTAYIRTEASSTGGWQKSHWHNKVLETYIVQAGWIGYAELADGAPRFRIYRAGELFTTEPFIIHNVYMPGNAVIHTIKHGDGRDERRLEDDRTDAFTLLTEAIDEAELQRLAAIAEVSFDYTSATLTYTEAYRHFDNLIWQASAWSSGLFTLALAGMTQVSNTSPLITALSLSYPQLLASLGAMFSGFILVISHALYRFRWHQSRGKGYLPNRPLLSPQVGLQLMVNLQALILLIVAAALSGLNGRFYLIAAAALIVGIEIYQERRIMRAPHIAGPIRETRS